MSAFSSALALYRTSAGKALEGLGRSAWCLVYLLGAHIVLDLVQTRIHPAVDATGGFNGFLFGFLVALLHCGIIGLYLSLIEITVLQRRKVVFSDISENGGIYLFEVLNVFFIFFIARLLLSPLGPLGLIATTVGTVLFNPMPEQIYQDRTQSLELLQQGLTFMGKNWPEWLGAHVVAAGVLVIAGTAVGSGGMSIGFGIWIMTVFGPFCGFIDAARFSFVEASRGGAMGVVMGAVLLIFVHYFMIFRGHLYRELSRGSRRSREWQQRMNGQP